MPAAGLLPARTGGSVLIRRRLVLASIAAALLVAASVLTPGLLHDAEETPLAAASAADASAIVAAIEAGAATVKNTLLPGTEPYERVTATVDGLKAAVTNDRGGLTSAQLDDVRAIARGAAVGVTQGVATATDESDRQSIFALARGVMDGALDEIAPAPDVARAQVDEAATKGIFSAIVVLAAGQTALPAASDLEAYGSTLVAGLFDGLQDQSVLLARAAGSPALADITLFTSDVVRGQLARLPAGSTADQVAALATLAAGALDGMIKGVVTSYPNGLPAPAREDLHRWFDSIARGHEGTPPWRTPAALPALLAWADGIGAAGVAGVDAARQDVRDRTSAPPTLDALGAWAEGLTAGALTHLQAVGSSAPFVADDAKAYAEAVAAPGVARIVAAARAPDPDVVEAYARGLSAGAADLVDVSREATGITDAWLAGLAGAVAGFPSDVATTQVALVEAYARGVTDRLGERAEAIAGAVGIDGEVAFVALFAESLGAGANKLANDTALSTGNLLEAYGQGLGEGFLGTRNPHRLLDDIDVISAATRTWISEGPPASPDALYQLVQRGVRDPYSAARAFGKAVGAAPLDWVESRGPAVVGQTFDTVDDLFWLQGFTQVFHEEVLANLPGDPRTDPAVLDYAAGVAGAIGDPSARIPDVIEAVSEGGDVYQHALAFGAFILAPTGWIAADPNETTVEAANATLQETLARGTNLTRFTDSAYAAAALAFVGAVTGAIETDPGPLPPAWVAGVVEAALDVPPGDVVTSEIGPRSAWVLAATAAAADAAKDGAKGQEDATRRYAREVTSWARDAPGHAPDPERTQRALVTWALATVKPALDRLPPAPTEEETDAILAYLDGVHAAVANTTPSLGWDPTTDAAILAYVAGISGGVDVVANETNLFLCANKINLSRCPPPKTPPGGDPEPCDGECPPEPDPECDAPCRFEAYKLALESWSATLVANGVEGLGEPDVHPTQAGLAVLSAWSDLVLAGHGACPTTSPDPRLDCDGPRGPVQEFAAATPERVNLTASLLAAGAAEMVTFAPEDPTGSIPSDPMELPLLAWAAGLQNAHLSLLDDPTGVFPNLTPPGEPDPAITPPPTEGADPANQTYRDALEAWTKSLFKAPRLLSEDVFPEIPETPGLDNASAEIDYLVADTIWRGGANAIFESGEPATNAPRRVLPNVSLDAWALGLANATQTTLIDPTTTDAQALLHWYSGLAQGGVAAVLAAGDQGPAQAAALTAYAQALGAYLAPPLPDEVAALFAPTPPPPERNQTGSGNQTSPDPQKEPTSYEVYLTNMQAHAMGLAEAARGLPTEALAAGADALAAPTRAALEGLVAAALKLPPVMPDQGYPARLSRWADAEAGGALTRPPTSPDRLGPDPDLAFVQAYAEEFASALAWTIGGERDAHTAWAQNAVAAALVATCGGADADACAATGAALGAALGEALGADADEMPLSTDDEQQALLDAFLASAGAAVEGLDPAAALALAQGLAAGLFPEGADEPDAESALAAAAHALGTVADELPLPGVRVAAAATLTFLLGADPSDHEALAEGAAAVVAGLGEQAADAATVEQRLQAYFAPGAPPAVRVSDGTRTRSGSALDGTAVFDAQASLLVEAFTGSSGSVTTRWELRWSPTDPGAKDAKVVPMSGGNGIFSAVLPKADLDALPAGATVRFAVFETHGATPTKHDRDGQPYAFVPDRDRPTATASAASPSGAHVALTWDGADGDSRVTGYRVEAREGAAGPWKPLAESTSQLRMSFSGIAGRAYTFRVFAIDAVAHESDPAVTAEVTIPLSASPNRPPTLAIRAPAEGDVFSRSVPVALDAADADGTTPFVRFCLQPERKPTDEVCPYEGEAAGGATLDTGGVADGRYRVRAIASDGTLNAEATSGVFRIDRAGPTIKGAAADASPTRVLLSALVEEDATRVDVATGSQTLSLTDEGRGVWTGIAVLRAGEHTLTFRASDAQGNEATISRTIVVPGAEPQPSGPTGATKQPPPEESPPAAGEDDAGPGSEGKKGAPGAAPLALLAALAALATLRRRRA